MTERALTQLCAVLSRSPDAFTPRYEASASKAAQVAAVVSRNEQVLDSRTTAEQRRGCVATIVGLVWVVIAAAVAAYLDSVYHLPAWATASIVFSVVVWAVLLRLAIAGWWEAGRSGATGRTPVARRQPSVFQPDHVVNTVRHEILRNSPGLYLTDIRVLVDQPQGLGQQLSMSVELPYSRALTDQQISGIALRLGAEVVEKTRTGSTVRLVLSRPDPGRARQRFES